MQTGKENDEARNSQYFLVARVIEEIGRVAKKIGDEVFHDSYSKSQVIRIPLPAAYQHSFLDGNEKSICNWP